MQRHIAFIFICLNLSCSVQGLEDIQDNQFQDGCLYKKKPELGKKRICNSDDSEGDKTNKCITSEFDYKEVRIFIDGWDTSIYAAWILQILLSEILDVPTTIESGDPNVKMNFYNPKDNFELGTRKNGNMYDVLAVANKHGSCEKTLQDPKSYTPCAHVSPEVWHENYGVDMKKDYFSSGAIDTPYYLGVSSIEGLFIPKFTAEKIKSFIGYFGLQGENSKNMAESFLRPMKWVDYCNKISANNCTSDDGIAKRYPEGANYDKFFVQDLYIGHFYAPPENDCDSNPECKGHIVDYPNAYNSNVVPLMYHLNISLASSGGHSITNGYDLPQLHEIWDAANATKSNVMALDWDLESAFLKYVGTDAEFTKVYMPPQTAKCMANRINLADRTSQNFTRRVGNKLGACDDKVDNLKKLVSRALHPDPTIHTAIQSPAYEAVKRFEVTWGNFVTIAQNSQKGTRREAVCQWVVENYKALNDAVPQSHPRTYTNNIENKGIRFSSLVLGCIAAFWVVMTGILVFQQKEKKLGRMSQTEIEFLFLILVGLLFNSIASILLARPATNTLCVVRIWLITIGNTLNVVPLIVKIATIVRVMNAAQKLKRVQVQRKSLYGSVLMVLAIVLIYLIVWSTVAPPIKMSNYHLSENNEMVTREQYCSSNHRIWEYIVCSWTTLLLLISTVLAFQIHAVHKKNDGAKDRDESVPLAVMTYSHFIFILLHLGTLTQFESKRNELFAYLQSLIYSFDSIAVLCIYFMPKFFGM